MENKAVGMLSTLLKMDEAVLTEKLNSEEGVNEITETAKNLKVYTNDEFKTVTDNLRTLHKDGIYKEVKGATLEMQEKALKEKHEGLKDLKRGTDYNTLEELMGIAITNAGNNASNDEELKTQLLKMQEGFGLKTDEWNTEREKLIAKHTGEIVTNSLSSEISKLKGVVDIEDDVVDGQLALFQNLIATRYSVKRGEDNNFIVLDEKGEKMVDDTYGDLSLADVVQKEAKNFFKFKTVTPKGGRGSDQQNKPVSGKVNWATHGNDFNIFLNSEEGKGIRKGSFEAQKLYAEFKEANK